MGARIDVEAGTRPDHENLNRPYTPEEDREILRRWWNRKDRPLLARDLGRTEAALAQRFYTIVHREHIDPKFYRRRMGETRGGAPLEEFLKAGAGSGRAGDPPPGDSDSPAAAGAEQQETWTSEEEMRLWRLVRSGRGWDEVAGELGGKSPEACQARYQSLEAANGRPADMTPLTELVAGLEGAGGPGGQPSEPGNAVGEGDRARVDDNDLFEGLASLPARTTELEERMQVLEARVQELSGRIEGFLQELSGALLQVSRAVDGQARPAPAFTALEAENERLRRELAALKESTARRERELRQVYNEIDFWLGEFLQMRRVEKVAHLGELIPRLKYSYDRFGVLLGIERT